MNSTGRTPFLLSLSALVVASLLTAPLQAVIIVDDSFSDGDFAKTGALDTNWWTSSSSSGKEISVGSLGLVTGTSGRGIHTIFPAVTLSNTNDVLKVTYTFTTPATVGVNRSTAFRVGLFDSLGRAGLDADVNASSGSPNDLYGWGAAAGGPGTATLPGYMFDMDVNLNGTDDDLNFREHLTQPSGVVGSGRLLSTTDFFDSISPSGADQNDMFAPNTQYTGMFIVRRLNATDFKLTGMLDSITHSVIDGTIDSDLFDFLGFHANSNTFGSSNSQNTPDNGIDFSNIKIEHFVPEPASIALLMGALIALPGMRRFS